MHAEDSPDTCGPNVADTCWSFSISTGGPVVEVRTPTDSTIDACEPDSIIWAATDPNGIDWSTAQVTIILNGADTLTYTADSAAMTIVPADDGDSAYIVCQIPPDLADGTTITACLTDLADSLGNPAETVCVDFSVDYNPPYFEILTPADGETVHTSQPQVEVILADSGSGLDVDSLYFVVNGDTLFFGDPCVSLVGDTLTFDPADCGIAWHGGDSVEICLHAQDLADTDFCGPNTLDTCWGFIIAAEPPVANLIRPADSSITACEPDTIIMLISDPDGVDPSSIVLVVNGDTFTVGTGLTFDGETLRYVLPADIPDGEVNACLLSASDRLGNEISPYCFTFWVDHTPPILISTLPEDSTLTSNTRQIISVALWDSLAGVDTASLTLTINGSEIPHFDLTLSMEGETLRVRYDPTETETQFAQGDTVEVHISIADQVDYCAGNTLDTSFVFFIEPEVGCLAHPNPFTPNGDGNNDMVVFNYPGMFTKSARLEVFDLRGVRVYDGEIGPARGFSDIASRTWDGKDSSGETLQPGLYLYVILVDGEVVCSGTVVLAR